MCFSSAFHRHEHDSCCSICMVYLLQGKSSHHSIQSLKCCRYFKWVNFKQNNECTFCCYRKCANHEADSPRFICVSLSSKWRFGMLQSQFKQGEPGCVKRTSPEVTHQWWCLCSHDQDLFWWSERLHGHVESLAVVPKVHLCAGRSCQLSQSDKVTQVIQHASKHSCIWEESLIVTVFLFIYFFMWSRRLTT